MRRLNQKEPRLLPKESDRAMQKVSGWGMVCVEDHDEFSGRVSEAIVQVAGLCVFIAGTRKVTNVEFSAESLQVAPSMLRLRSHFKLIGVAFLIRAAVIQKEDGHFFGWIRDGFGCGQSPREKIAVLVVGGHEHVDRREIVVVETGRAARGQRHRHDKKRQRQHSHAVHFAEINQEAGKKSCGWLIGGKVLVVRQ